MTVRPPVRLLAPDPSRFEAWAQCLADFGDGPMDGSGFRVGQAPLPSRVAFDEYLEACRTAEDRAVPLPPGRVHCSFRWIVDATWDDGGPLLGFVAVRHALTQFLLDQAGHVGYSVRPGARRQGVATAALARALELARGLGADPTLVCCLEENEASWRTILSVGGRYDGSRNGFRRYWFGQEPWPTAPTAEPQGLG